MEYLILLLVGVILYLGISDFDCLKNCTDDMPFKTKDNDIELDGGHYPTKTIKAVKKKTRKRTL